MNINNNHRIICGTICFVAGAALEASTFSKTKDVGKSIGLGWGLAALIIFL
jgi:hypothetical protein